MQGARVMGSVFCACVPLRCAYFSAITQPTIYSMKKTVSLFAAAMLGIAVTAPAAIIFNPENPTSVVDQDGFTGSFNPATNYSMAFVFFDFSGLNPAPSFDITNITLQGDGITGSLSFNDLTINGDGLFAAGPVNLTTPTNVLNFANSRLSFDLPGNNAINDGATFSVLLQYRSANQLQLNTSETGPIFEAQNSGPGPEPIPEPGTWAAAALLVGGAAFMRWRRRQTA
jgi:MYXO-CTERM domain-containing protein